MKRLSREREEADSFLDAIPEQLVLKVEEHLFGKSPGNQDELSDCEDIQNGFGNPRAKRKRKRRETFNEKGHVSDKKVSAIRREVKAMVHDAMINCTTFEGLNIRNAREDKSCVLPEPPLRDIRWGDNVRRMGMSEDGVPWIFFISEWDPIHNGRLHKPKIGRVYEDR